jgi:DNA repair protein RadC
VDPLSARSAGPEPLEPAALDVTQLALRALAPRGSRQAALLGELFAREDLAELSRATHASLRAHGFGARLATRWCAAFELGRRVERARVPRGRRIDSPARVFELMACELRGLRHETFWVLLLDGKHRLRRRQPVSTGTLTASLVHPREVFAPALRERAAAIVCVHNHPSGDPEPSREDVAVTRRLVAVGRLVGVPLVDHVVVADQGYASLRERIDFDAGATLAEAAWTDTATAAAAAVSMRST